MGSSKFKIDFGECCEAKGGRKADGGVAVDIFPEEFTQNETLRVQLHTGLLPDWPSLGISAP